LSRRTSKSEILVKLSRYFILPAMAFWLAAAAAEAAVDPAASGQDVEQRVSEILSRMTLDEKLGQMSQTGFPEKLTEKIKAEIRAGRWGSFYGGTTPEIKVEAQRIAMNESKQKIPLIFGADLIHGFHTTFPIPLGESASWNPELIERAARVTAREAVREGIHWTFAPMMDIGRDPRWGRIAETLGEDPYLSGRLAAAMVHGFQGQSLADADSIAACGKHYVGYGAAEGGRDYNTTWIPEPLLRDVYLQPFAAAREAGIASFMSAFNDLNGVPASANEFTLRRILRDEWKFDGLVVSDYEAVSELILHGYAADESDAARKAIMAGVNMEMVSTTYRDHGKSLVESGRLDPRFIDEAVRNILRLKLRLGLFDARGVRPPEGRATPTPEAMEVAKELAEQSLVLLKNESGTLPLAKSIGKIAVIGPLADAPRDQLGAWAADHHSPSRTPLAAFRETLGEKRVAYAPGLKASDDESRDGFAAALAAARGADVVILFLGEEADMSGEASSRAYLNLPGAQEELAAEMAKAGKPMIAVIMAGRPLTFHDVAGKMSAVLWAFHPGSMGGPAIVETIFGANVPSGKLTVTFPRTVGQVPIYYNRMNTGRPPAADGREAEHRFTSKYLDVSFTPEYPFGYGLSYSRFKYSNFHVSDAHVKLGGALRVSADVANAGNFEADEIVQLYIRQLSASLTQPVRELKGFSMVHLKPGEKSRVEFRLTTDQLAFHNAEGILVTEPGEFQVWIGGDSTATMSGGFRMDR
jgi:beta-glucosidase